MIIQKVWVDATSVYAMTTEGMVAKYEIAKLTLRMRLKSLKKTYK